MVGAVRSASPLLLLNFAILSATYVTLLISGDVSFASVAGAAGGAFLFLVAVLTFGDGARTLGRRQPSSPALRTALAVVPWVLLTVLIGARGLWWTQRPPMLRFFLAWAIANWSIVCCVSHREFSQNLWTAGSRRALLLLACALGALAIQGAGFGVMPFGCALSAAMGGIAVVALGVACFHPTSAHLKVFAACAATFVALLLVEVSVRLLRIGQNVREVDSREYARDFYSLTPPRTAFVNDPKPLDEFGPALIEINSLGIRGPELPDPRTDLLLIGDSMIEARQLPWHETLGPRLQEALRVRGMPLRVVAHGMRGWSPLLEWNWYLKVGRRLQPKAVMLFFFWNDLWIAGDEVSTFRANVRADGRPDGFRIPVDSKWIWYTRVRLVRVVADAWRRVGVAEVRRAFAIAAQQRARGSLDDSSADRLARSLNEAPLSAAELETILTTREPDLPPHLRELSQTTFWPGVRPWTVWTEAQRSAAAKTELELQRFAEDVASDGGRLVIVYVPNPLQVGANECAVGRLFGRLDTNVVLPPDSGIQTWLRDVTGRHRIELLDPSSSMREFNRARPADDLLPLYLRADCHWSARGHRFMAEYLAEWCSRHMGASR